MKHFGGGRERQAETRGWARVRIENGDGWDDEAEVRGNRIRHDNEFKKILPVEFVELEKKSVRAGKPFLERQMERH